jgi:hypothetical protein
MALISPGTGWVAIGFGTTMQSAQDMIMGGRNTSSAYCIDMLGNGYLSPTPDSEQNILDYDATDNSTHTILEFSFPLNSTDSNDVVLEVDGTYSMFFGYHVNSDDTSIPHAFEGYSQKFLVYILPEGDEGNGDIPLDIGEFDVSIPYSNGSTLNIDGDISPQEYSQSNYDIASSMTVYWDHTEDNLTIGLVAPGTGWVAFGIGEKFKDNGANMFMGGVDNNGPYCYDMVGLSNFALPHATDESQGGQNDILAYDAFENSSMTILEFAIPLNSSDNLDPIIEEGKIYSMFIGYQESSDDITVIHTAHSPVFKAFIRPPVINIETFLLLDVPDTVENGDNFTISITLSDENNTLEDVPITFFLETQFGEFEIGEVETGVDGVASITYANPNLYHTHILGARSEEIIAIEGGEVKAYASSEEKLEIDFMKEKEEEESIYKDISRVGLLTAFWITGVIIWGSFGVSAYSIIQIYRDRNSDIPEKLNTKHEESGGDSHERK